MSPQSDKTLKAPRGTKDILPPESRRWEWVQEVARDLFERYGYRRIVFPTFEATELFQRAIGEATEIVQKEMYTFTDRGGRSITLRPEGTASVVRAHIEHSLHGRPQPVKLYYIGPMYRYERPQAGRYREFWQLGVEVLGSADPAVDAEVILLLLEYYRAVGITELETKINSMGCPECRPAYVDILRRYLQGEGAQPLHLCPECRERAQLNPLRVFDCKQPSCKEALAGAPRLSGYLCENCRQSFAEVQSLLEVVGEKYTVDPMLVRGFDYYTRTTFEVQSPRLGAQNALGGGGRYDLLVEEYGGPKTPAIGFAVGVERVLLALPEDFTYDTDGIRAFVATADSRVRPEAFRLLQALRAAGVSADMDYAGRSLKGQMKHADRSRARFVLVLGPEELARGACRLRDMAQGDERLVSLTSVVEEVSKS